MRRDIALLLESGQDAIALIRIVQKKRSKSIYVSNVKKLKTSKPEATRAPASLETVSEITSEASSCFSADSSGKSHCSKTSASDKQRNRAIPTHMGHKAAAIMRVLSDGSASEVMIRQLLGDSPSTSKALRMLLRLQAVKRFGVGGRSHPYIYMIFSNCTNQRSSNAIFAACHVVVFVTYKVVKKKLKGKDMNKKK